jgi:NAD(P)H-dependent FMN reductase
LDHRYDAAIRTFCLSVSGGATTGQASILHLFPDTGDLIDMALIIGISGSLRKQSFNASLLRAAVELAPAGLTIEIGSIQEIPLYNFDVEHDAGIPAAVTRLKEQIAAADGLLLVTPEYNNSIPGVFKNAIDWLSRPTTDIPKVFGQRAVGLIGASPGNFGTILSQNAWLATLRTLGTRPWFSAPLYVSSAGKVFDEQGVLVDSTTRERLRKYLQGFAQFIG